MHPRRFGAQLLTAGMCQLAGIAGMAAKAPYPSSQGLPDLLAVHACARKVHVPGTYVLSGRPRQASRPTALACCIFESGRNHTYDDSLACILHGLLVQQRPPTPLRIPVHPGGRGLHT